MSSKTQLLDAASNTVSEREQPRSNGEPLFTDEHSVEMIRREQIFEILSNERRRLVLRYLRDRREKTEIEFRSLVDQVTAWETETEVNRLDSGERKCVYTALRQTHLPKLDALGVIEFDQQRGTLKPKPAVEKVFLYMKHVPERERFWSRLYLGLALFCSLFVLVFWSGVVPVGNVSGLAVAVGISASFGVFSIVQLHHWL